MASRPVWGAWIEIQPQSDRGHQADESRPVWGAWIEIPPIWMRVQESNLSRPVWGAWIEIPDVSCAALERLRRAPYGARGLK